MSNANGITKGCKNMATRIEQAETNFIATLMFFGDINTDEAARVLALYRKLRVVKRDAVNGVINVKHGALLNRDVIRRALTA